MPRDTTHVNIVRAAGLTGFEELVRELGAEPAALLRSCGIEPGDLEDPDRYVPYRGVAMAIEQAARTLGVRDFGLRLCARQDLAFLGLLALVIQSAASVREGMLLGAKYVHFHTPALGYRVVQDPDTGLECVQVLQRLPELAGLPQTVELCVGHLCRILGVLSDRALRPVSIHLRHARLGTEAQYRRHLGQLPHFNAAFDGIAIQPLAWRQPMAGHNQLLQHFVERFLLGLSPARTQSFADQVSGVLRNLLRVGMADLGTVARTLDQHPRTLQRRLHAEGMVFEELRDGARKAWASQLLGQPSLSLRHIAHLLGFADPSVLTRACQRWFGTTPRRLRREAA